jgi:hypothetical protein
MNFDELNDMGYTENAQFASNIAFYNKDGGELRKW